MPLTRTFEGKKYTSLGGVKDKSEAQKMASRSRKSGAKARVTKRVHTNLRGEKKVMWFVWSRK